MTATDLDAELARIEARARRRMWWWLPAIGVLGGVAGVTFGSFAETHRRHAHHHNPAVGITVAAVVTVLIVMALVVVKRRRGRLWPPAPLGFGLTRDQRRVVKRDLRRGTVSDDPVLAEVERRTVGRVVRQSRYNRYVYPLIVAVLALNIALPDRTPLGRGYFAVLLVAFLAVWPYQARHLRRLRAFPRQAASGDGGGVHG